MLTSSFIFMPGLTDELERALWGRGIISWDVLRKHHGEAVEVLGGAKAQKLLEHVNEAQRALEAGDHAWFRQRWPARDLWRLWRGYCKPEEVAFVDIETTGLTPGFDQITVIGCASAGESWVYVADKPQPGDRVLDAFLGDIKRFRLVVTFNGLGFDVPFIERHFRDANYHLDQPHIDLLPAARSLGLNGGLKDMEKQLGIARSEEIGDMRGSEAIQLWGAWKNGDLAAYRKLTTYCKADCVNLHDFTDYLYAKKWAETYTPYAKDVDLDSICGEQLSLF